MDDQAVGDTGVMCSGVGVALRGVFGVWFGKKCRLEEFFAVADILWDDDRMVIEVLSRAQA